MAAPLALLLVTATATAGSFAPPRPKFHFTPRFGCEIPRNASRPNPAAVFLCLLL